MKRKQIISKIINERPDAVLVKNKYQVLYGMIKRMYPDHIDKIPKQIFIDIIFDAINGNRDWQVLTEGQDKENKSRLSQEKMIEMGYLPGLKQNIKKLQTLY